MTDALADNDFVAMGCYRLVPEAPGRTNVKHLAIWVLRRRADWLATCYCLCDVVAAEIASLPALVSASDSRVHALPQAGSTD